MKKMTNPSLAGPSGRSRRYNRLKRRLACLDFCLGAGYLALLLASGLSVAAQNLAAALSPSPVVQAACYLALVLPAYELITLPLAFYSGFVVERRYGLSRQGPAAWAWDWVKSLLLSLGLALVLVELLYLAIRLWPQWWWLAAGFSFTLVFILLAQAAPIIFLPLFFKFRPLENQSLRDRLETLCVKAGAPVLGIFEWGLGAKTRRANAAVMGLGRTRRVVLADTLIAEFTPSEIEVVLAHELGHHRLGHLGLLLGLQTTLIFTSFLVAHLAYGPLAPFFGLAGPADLAGLPLFALIFLGVGLVVLPAVNAFSRALERRADLFALRLTNLSGSFITAMEKLAALNLAETDPDPLMELLFHSHPSIRRRIQAASRFQTERRP